jgi:hypothetical protein
MHFECSIHGQMCSLLEIQFYTTRTIKMIQKRKFTKSLLHKKHTRGSVNTATMRDATAATAALPLSLISAIW